MKPSGRGGSWAWLQLEWEHSVLRGGVTFPLHRGRLLMPISCFPNENYLMKSIKKIKKKIKTTETAFY